MKAHAQLSFRKQISNSEGQKSYRKFLGVPSELLLSLLNFGINTFWFQVKVEGMTDERGTSTDY